MLRPTARGLRHVPRTIGVRLAAILQPTSCLCSLQAAGRSPHGPGPGFQASGGRNGGRRRPWPVACSNACASCSTPQSSRCRPTICRPTGRPLCVNPAGTEIAGHAHERHVPARPHPVDVGRHRRAVDRGRVRRGHVERRRPASPAARSSRSARRTAAVLVHPRLARQGARDVRAVACASACATS